MTRRLTVLPAVFLATLLLVPMAAAQTYSLGPPDHLIGAGSNYFDMDAGLVFDASVPFTLDSVNCLPNGAGTLVINLRDSGGAILQSYTQSVSSGGVVTVPVNFVVATGTGYQINATGTATGGLYRNTSGVSYPYTEPGVASITDAINGIGSFYYYFYNWQLTVAPQSTTYSLGPVDHTFATGSNYTVYPEGLVFDALYPFTLDSVKCLPNAAGDVVVNLHDSGGVLLQTVTYPVSAGGLTTIPLGFSIPVGTGYALNAVGTSTGGLYRNTAGGAFPYILPGICHITGNINGIASFYYFFYDWQISATALATPLWQINSPEAALDIDGLQGTFFEPAITSLASGGSVTFSGASTLPVGTACEIALNAAPLAPSAAPGAWVSLKQQVLNIDLTDPTTVFLFSTVAGQLGSWPGNFSVNSTPAGGGTFSAQMFIMDATHPDGFRLSQAVQVDVLTCVYQEDFETAMVGDPGVYPTGWTDGGGFRQWRVHSGPAGGSSTGPSGDFNTGAGQYVYCDAGFTTATGDTYILVAPALSTSGLTTPVVSFAYHMWGATMGTLHLDVRDAGGAWVSVWSLTGNQGNAWKQASVAVTPVGGQVEMRFRYLRGPGYTSDCALDNVLLCE